MFRIAAIVAGAAMAWLGWSMTSALDPAAFPASLPRGMTSPIMAIELAVTEQDVDGVLGDRGPALRQSREAALLETVRLDGRFIVAYTAWCVLLGVLVAARGRALLAVGVLAGALAAVAAICDVVENARLTTLLTMGPGAAPGPRPWALAKFGAFHAALGLGSLAFFLEPGDVGVQRWIRRLAGLAGVASALVGVPAALLAWTGGIEGALRLAALHVAVGTAFFLTIAWLRDGLLEALNRLAARPGLRWLASFPSDE